MRTRSVLFLLASFLLSCGFTIPAMACPPPDCGACCHWVPPSGSSEGYCELDTGKVCGDCDDCNPRYTCAADGSSCEWDCTTGQCCDDGTCVDNCPSDECCSGGTCVSTCPSGQCCSGGTCESSCPTGECCDSGTCEALDTTWSPTAGVSVTADDSIKNKVNDAINSIPLVSGVEVTEVVGSISGKIRDCCGDGDLQHEVCSWGTLTLSASIGRIQIWGPPVFVEGVDFGLWGASINVEAGVFVEGAFEASGSAGLWTNPCDTGCLYGSASLSTSATISGSVTAFGCVKIWGHDYCTPTVSGTVSASIGFTGTYNFNECGSWGGASGDITLDDIAASISVTVGSYTGSFSKTI